MGARNCKKGMYECFVHSDHVTCTCPCYKYNNFCKHSLCVAEKVAILKEHLAFLRKSLRQKAPSKSALVEPTKDAQGKKGGSHKNPWRPSRARCTRGTSQSANERPFTEIHHNNKSLVLCFLDDVLDEEKWSYLDPQQPGSKLPSTKYTTKYYCVKGSCIKTRFPYYDSLLLQIPPEASSRL